jgi:predicted dehydrogenase
VSLAALEGGKHVYSEKPLSTTVADGARVLAAARARERRVGAAPDTILGAGYQTARRTVDAGRIGRPLSAVAAVMSHGMEHWHPNPGFFFRKGAGPVLDMGPYYVSALVSLLGPVSSVQAVGQIGFAERTVSTPSSKLLGHSIRVETPTSVQALLEFASGAQATFLASWDVWKHSLPPIELHGEIASLRLPDPNWFGGRVEIAEGRDGWRAISARREPFSAVNWPLSKPVHANYRGLGLADMARAIIEDRSHRADGALALHALAVMTGMLDAAAEGRKVNIAVQCERPRPLEAGEARSLLTEGSSTTRPSSPPPCSRTRSST